MTILHLCVYSFSFRLFCVFFLENKWINHGSPNHLLQWFAHIWNNLWEAKSVITFLVFSPSLSHALMSLQASFIFWHALTLNILYNISYLIWKKLTVCVKVGFFDPLILFYRINRLTVTTCGTWVSRLLCRHLHTRKNYIFILVKFTA